MADFNQQFVIAAKTPLSSQDEDGAACIAVPVPGFPGGRIYMRRSPGAYNDQLIVLADPRKMAKAWADDIRKAFRRAHPLKVIFGQRSKNYELRLYDHSSPEQSVSHLNKLTRQGLVAAEMPQVVYRPDGYFGYTNGIHRTFNLAKAGATSIPVEISPDTDIEGFLRRFGAAPPPGNMAPPPGNMAPPPGNMAPPPQTVRPSSPSI